MIENICKIYVVSDLSSKLSAISFSGTTFAGKQMFGFQIENVSVSFTLASQFSNALPLRFRFLLLQFVLHLFKKEND